MKRFTATLYRGHSDSAVIVPFDPGTLWQLEPRRIGYRKYVGYAVRGRIAGVTFESWIWLYFHEWRMVIADAVLAKAKVEPGDAVTISVEPHAKPEQVAPYVPGGTSVAKGVRNPKTK